MRISAVRVDRDDRRFMGAQSRGSYSLHHESLQLELGKRFAASHPTGNFRKGLILYAAKSCARATMARELIGGEPGFELLDEIRGGHDLNTGRSNHFDRSGINPR